MPTCAPGPGHALRALEDQALVGSHPEGAAGDLPVACPVRAEPDEPGQPVQPGGSRASREGSRWSIPKADLIAAAQVALQTRTLKIAVAFPTAQLLADELGAYRVTVNEDGRDTYGNGREAPNDESVLALAIATYTATRPRRRTRITHVGPEPPLGIGSRFTPDATIPNDIFP